MSFLKSIIFVFFLLPAISLFAQKDSTVKKTSPANNSPLGDGGKTVPKKQRINIFSIDTSKPYNPKVAIVRSAILPGWGQATNKKYWKMPIVYGALGTTAYIFFRNVKQFREANAA